MRLVAGEMEREGFTLPLLIGGATTSRAHTAVKIDPAVLGSGGPRPGRVARCRRRRARCSIRSSTTRSWRETRAEYEAVRRAHEGRTSTEQRLTLAAGTRQPRADRLGRALTPPRPTFLGARAFNNFPLEELVQRIDWTPFFSTWELAGRYPEILTDPVVGEAASGLFRDAQKLLQRVVDQRLLRANAVVGFWPANATPDDDIVIWTRRDADGRADALPRAAPADGTPGKGADRPNVAISDFVAPIDTGVADYVGAFAVTAGVGLEEARAKFESQRDDYNAILLTALADRLAEAFAERMHEKVRRELWGYAPNEALDNDALIAEAYQGIRPAPGLSGLPRPHGEAPDLRCARRGVARRHHAHRIDGHAARLVGQRLVFLAPAVALLRARSHRSRPARGLRPAQGLEPRRGGALARAEPRRGMSIVQLRAAARPAFEERRLRQIPISFKG